MTLDINTDCAARAATHFYNPAGAIAPLAWVAGAA
jgi:hypothetical protein